MDNGVFGPNRRKNMGACISRIGRWNAASSSSNPMLLLYERARKRTLSGLMADNTPILPSTLPRAIAGGRAAGATGVRTNALVLALALAAPVLVHMAPWGGATPLGAFLLPMFWAAFVAVYLYGIRAALLVAVFGPVLNTFLTKFPEFRFNAGVSFELLVFVVFAWTVMRSRRGRGFWLLAPLAYVLAKACSSGLRAAGVAVFGSTGAWPDLFTRAVSNGVPGLVALALINVALVKGWIGSGGSHDGNGHGPEAAA